MAKRKKTKSIGAVRRRTTRRKRVSGIGAADLNDAIFGIGGAVATRALINMIGKKVDLIGKSETNKAAAQLALGFVLPMVVKNPTIASVSAGNKMIGGFMLVKSLMPNIVGSTDGEVIMITGAPEIDEVNGIDEIGALEIDEVNGVDEIGEAHEYEGF